MSKCFQQMSTVCRMECFLDMCLDPYLSDVLSFFTVHTQVIQLSGWHPRSIFVSRCGPNLHRNQKNFPCPPGLRLGDVTRLRFLEEWSTFVCGLLCLPCYVQFWPASFAFLCSVVLALRASRCCANSVVQTWLMDQFNLVSSVISRLGGP